jgi:protein-L-isoaspartate(D-aspartate) O-methyltransferase
LCRYLVTLERIGELQRRAEALLDSMNYRNIGFIHSDDYNSARGTFDSIIVAAGADILPEEILNKLEEGGRLIIPVSNGSGHTIRKIIKVSSHDLITEDIGEATFVPYITGEPL